MTQTTTTTTIIQSGEVPFLTGEELPPHSGELNHAFSQVGGPTQSQLSRPVSSGHHKSMEHRLRRKHLLLHHYTKFPSGIFSAQKQKKKHKCSRKTKTCVPAAQEAPAPLNGYVRPATVVTCEATGPVTKYVPTTPAVSPETAAPAIEIKVFPAVHAKPAPTDEREVVLLSQSASQKATQQKVTALGSEGRNGYDCSLPFFTVV